MPSNTYPARFPQNVNPNPNRLYDLVLSVSTNDQPSNNRSIVNWTLSVVKVGSFRPYSFDQRPWSVTIDGATTNGTWAYDFRNSNSLTLGNGSRIVNHNSDGSKTIGVAASANGGNPLGIASLSNSFALTTYPRAPSAPSFVNAQAPIARSIAVNWGASSGGAGVQGYTVETSVNSGTYGSGFNTGGTSFTFTNLVPGSTYRYRVRAYGSGGTSGFTQSNSRTIAPAASPPVTTAERTLRTVEVTMTEPSVIDNTTNIVSYTTQRRQNNGAWGDQKTTTDLNNRSITYTDLPSETNQQFRGRANTNRGSSNFSESQTLFIPGIPDAPSQVFAFRQGAAIQVIVAEPTQDGGAPILTYTIEKRISGDLEQTWSEWEELLITPFDEPSYLYENLELQKTYQFRALATNEEGDSEQFTESESVYLPAIMRIYDGDQFRLPVNYKKYDESMGDWVGLNVARRYFNEQWIDLE